MDPRQKLPLKAGDDRWRRAIAATMGAKKATPATQNRIRRTARDLRDGTTDMPIGQRSKEEVPELRFSSF
jgi:hypothetical protein